MPMGIFSIAGILKKNGFDVEIIHLDLEVKKKIEEIIDFAAADAVGFDLHWTNQSLNVLDTAELLKKMKPDLHVFLGGYTATFFAGEILKEYPAVDTIIQGDGEIPAVELCKALYLNINRQNRNPGEFKRLLQKVQNLVYRGDNNEILFNGISYVSGAQEMDQFGFAEIELLRNREFYRDLSRYWTNFPPFNLLPMFFLEIGRGCSYNCTICGGNRSAQVCLNNRKGQVVRSLDSVIASIKKLLAYGYSCFMACFDFEGYEQWYINLFGRITQEKLAVSFTYECWSLPSKALVDAMSECCRNAIIAISPDSADLSIRRQNKDTRLFYTNEELEECLDYTRTGSNVRIQLWFGFFLPGDTEKTIYKTLDYIMELFLKYSPYIEITYMNINTDPASSLYLNPDRFFFDVKVRHFKDYILTLKEDYTIAEGKKDGLTLLSKPSCLSDIEAVDLANKITFFNRLFYFKDSLLLILKNAENPGIISDRLKKIDLSLPKESDFTANNIRKFLLDVRKEQGAPDEEIVNTLDREYGIIASKSLLKTTQFYRYEKKGTGKVTVRDKDDNCARVNKNDSRKFAVNFDF
jgi:hypothetical protein